MLRYLIGFSNLFFLQLFCGELLFATILEKKEHFKKRLLTAIILGDIVAVSLYMLLYQTNIYFLYNTLYYSLIFLVSLFLLKAIYNESFSTLFLCSAFGYLLQHITSQILLIIQSLVNIRIDVTEPLGALISVIVQVPFTAILYLIFNELFAKKITTLSYDNKGENRLVNLSIITVITVILLSSIRDYYVSESLALAMVSRSYSILCCLFLLYLRTYIVDVSKQENERNIINQLYHEQQKQYEINKETIDLINEKCHDMRHQLLALENLPAKDELKELINIYDDTIHTGNATLDTIFAEKSIICQKHGIRLSPMIDGSAIDFMEIGDICSLFGNILENAIEAVMKLDNPCDRIISIKVQNKSGMTIITSDNYYTGNISPTSNELPTTTKNNLDYHGFGLKSIKRIAKKYGGTLTINTDDMFHLIVTLFNSK